MITVEEARKIILKCVKPLGAVSVDLREASGRVLSEDVVASEAIPPFDNSAMDGYAVRAKDVLTGVRTLRVVEEIPAGKVATKTLKTGQAMRIMTGAMIPEGADAVIPLEKVEVNGTQVKVLKEVRVGENIRKAGGDIQPGTVLLKKGRRLLPADIGVLASLGYSKVKVAEQPRVAILSTGDELLEIGKPLEPGKIRNSNSVALSSLLKSFGAVPIDLGIAKDRKGEIEQKIILITSHQLPITNILVTIGGVSVGDYDFVQEVLKEMGMEVLFWKVSVKPGKPLLFGRLQDTLVFGLPGNPVSTMVTSELFIKPALYKMMGRDWEPNIVRATLRGKPLKRKDEREWYVTAITEYQDGRFVTTPTSGQGSSLLTSFSSANSLIIMKMDAEEYKEGDEVPAMFLEMRN